EEINKSELNQHIINISSLSKGLYYLTITSGNYSQNLKFIKE
ncbi:MAG: T9SS type A sorting domain-containing protein, partial [Bacteroidia bacterium]|nr:T9SS type A sorting domain-containing protein [Bacteroidia bacterium]